MARELKTAKASASASIANLGPGFDVFAIAIRGPADRVTLSLADTDSVHVTGVGAETIGTGFDTNAASVAVDSIRAAAGIDRPLRVAIEKGIPPGGGLGSSAASAVAGVLAFAELFSGSRGLGPLAFLEAAADGEEAVAGRHYDNISAAMFGGFIVLASTDLPVIERFPVPPSIHIAVATPEVEMLTREMRAILPAEVRREDAVANVGNATALALALIRGDARAAGKCLHDRIVEPLRAKHLPAYAEVRQAALGAGAHGFAISGAGSSVFALASSRDSAAAVAEAMQRAFEQAGLGATSSVALVNNVNPAGLLFHQTHARFRVP